MTKRHDYIDATIAQSWDLLHDPNVANALSPREIQLATHVLDNLVVLNIDEQGNAIMPNKYKKEDKYPILALHSGEKATIHNRTPSPMQIQVMREVLGDRFDEGAVDRIANAFVEGFENSPSRIVMPEDSSAATLKSAKGFSQTPGSPLRIFNRPGVAIRYFDNKKQLPNALSGLVHEGGHIIQVIAKSAGPIPQDVRTETLSDELDAHRLSARLLAANAYRPEVAASLTAGGSDTLSILTEHTRKQHNTEQEPYRIDAELIGSLADAGILNALISG